MRPGPILLVLGALLGAAAGDASYGMGALAGLAGAGGPARTGAAPAASVPSALASVLASAGNALASLGAPLEDPNAAGFEAETLVRTAGGGLDASLDIGYGNELEGARGVMSEISDWVSSLAAGGALAGPAADGAADVAAALDAVGDALASLLEGSPGADDVEVAYDVELGSGAPGDESLVSVSVRAPRGAVPDSDTLLAALAAAAARARVTGGVMLATSVEEVGFLGAASLTQLTLLAVGLVALATALALVAGCSADDDLVEAGSEGDAEEQGLAQPLVDGKDGWRLAVAHGDA